MRGVWHNRADHRGNTIPTYEYIESINIIGVTRNQNDHILINKGLINLMKDTRVYWSVHIGS